jgi:hypothetical protein
VSDACEVQSPVVMVVNTSFPSFPMTSVISTSSTKMSKLNPKAFGSRLKYPGVVGKNVVSFVGQMV